MDTMYEPKVNSPATTLNGTHDSSITTITVVDVSVFPDAPNIAVIGIDESAETILYTGKTATTLTGVTRGFQGTASSWSSGTIICRAFTDWDLRSLQNNVDELDTNATNHAADVDAHHDNSNDPTSDEKAALAGTSGTPSASNLYVTDSDSRMTDSRTPISHTHTESEISDLSHTDNDAIHTTTAAEVSALTEKTSLVNDDVLVIEDSEASYGKKKVLVSNLPGGGDTSAIHTDEAAELSALTEKITPVDADIIVIEDSADLYTKKKVQISNLPAAAATGIGIIPKTARFDGVLSAGYAQQFSILEVDATLTTVRLVLRGSLPVGQSIKVQVTKNGSAPADSVLASDLPIEITTSETAEANGVYVVEGTLDSGMTTCSKYDWFQATITQVGSDYAGNDLDVQLVFE
jgi:hypothetical protein